MVDELERLRLQRILSDWITGLPLYPVADLRNDSPRWAEDELKRVSAAPVPMLAGVAAPEATP